MDETDQIPAPSSHEEQQSRSGQTPFVPTQVQREVVLALVSFGIPQADIARVIINPSTSRPISDTTLRAHFSDEIDTGQVRANAQVGKFIFGTITGQDAGNPNSIVRDERSRATLAMFWAKTRMNWKETIVRENADDTRTAEELTDAELEAIVRRRRSDRAKAVMRAKEDDAPQSTAVH